MNTRLAFARHYKHVWDGCYGGNWQQISGVSGRYREADLEGAAEAHGHPSGSLGWGDAGGLGQGAGCHWRRPPRTGANTRGLTGFRKGRGCHGFTYHFSWLVLWNIFFFPNSWDDDPIWRTHIFQGGGEKTPTSFCLKDAPLDEKWDGLQTIGIPDSM